MAAAEEETSSKVSDLVKLLAKEQSFSTLEIAETLWLALQIEPVEIDNKQRSRPKKKATPAVSSLAEKDPSGDTPPPAPAPAKPPRADVTTARGGVLPAEVLPVWIVNPAMLRDPLAVMRSLKPLLSQRETGAGERLDESATVEGIARTRLWLPVLEPEKEPWFDLVLVVDRSASMSLWQQLIKDLIRTFKRYGAFRNLQVFDLAVAAANDSASHAASTPIKPEDAVRLKAHPVKAESARPGHRPSELIEQRGRRIVMVLSDCAAGYWWNGQLLPMLQDWTKAMPVVVWQMLPEWMWARTALSRGTAVALSNGLPGVENQRLVPCALGRKPLGRAERGRSPIPVVTSDPSDLNNWGLMLSGDRRELTPGFLLPPAGGAVPRARSIEEIARAQVSKSMATNAGDPASQLASEADIAAAIDAQIAAIAKTRIERFLALASPSARRLLVLLAAAPVITLPVMRLIRDSMMVDSSADYDLFKEPLDETVDGSFDGAGERVEGKPLDGQSTLPVAEVFMSGLIRRVSEGESDRPETLARDPEELVQYDFVPKVRKLLLNYLPQADTIEVVNRVSAAVEKQWKRHSNEQFRAFLTNPNIQEPALAGARAFASVTAEILEPLGGNYADFAQQLREATSVSEARAQRQEHDDDFEIPPLRTLNFFRAEVKESAPPVDLVMDEFTVATVEIEPVEDTGEKELSLFEFEVATLLASKAGWEVYREVQSAYQYIEPLGEAAGLEMVSVPAGTFTMGSPENESGRFDDESPQHEVIIEAFFIGKHPITQVQWRFVASLAPINRELESDPSAFKGDERPVESVSWYEAVEFCDRLSHLTGSDYQLPTEVQWEYACRAGTTTPFHFGETILPKLANYNCTQAYNGGAEGKSYQETTPVDYSEFANAFGLYDMHGNVWEWCVDTWHGSCEGAPTDGSAWLDENENSDRVLRGGSWSDDPGNCRSATRLNFSPNDRYVTVGFRVCCHAP